MIESRNEFTPTPKITNRPPRILLLYPPFPPFPNLSPPLGMALIAAAMREHGAEIAVLDMAAFRIKDKDYNSRMLELFDKFKPDAVGLSVIIGALRYFRDTIDRLKSLGKFPIIVGGPHPTVATEEMLNYGVSIAVRGEGENTAKELVEWLEGKRDLDRIDGISYRDENGSVRHNPDRALIEDLDTLPLPAHDLFDPKDYFDSHDERVRAGKIISSRGCPNKCAFCGNPIFGRKFRYRSADSVVKEMNYLRDFYGMDQFEFLDDAFTVNRPRLMELAATLKKMPDATFSCVTRLENLDDETVPALRAAGLYRAHIGVESGRPETLKRLHKNIKLEKLEPTLRLLKKNGVESSLFFMFGFPWENAEEMRETNEFIKKLAPLTTYFNEGGVLTPYPATEIYEEYHRQADFTDWWIPNRQPPAAKQLAPYSQWIFFQYDDDQLNAIREGLKIILEHNASKRDAPTLRKQVAYLQTYVGNLEAQIKDKNRQLTDLEAQIKDKNKQLKEIWERSTQEKLKRFLLFVKKLFNKRAL